MGSYVEDAIYRTVCVQHGASNLNISNNTIISAVISWILMALVAIGSHVELFSLSPKLSKNGARRGGESKKLRANTRKLSKARMKRLLSDILSIST